MGHKSCAFHGSVCYSDHRIGELIACCQLSVIYFGKSMILMDFFLDFLTVVWVVTNEYHTSNMKSFCWAFGLWFYFDFLFIYFRWKSLHTQCGHWHGCASHIPLRKANCTKMNTSRKNAVCVRRWPSTEWTECKISHKYEIFDANNYFFLIYFRRINVRKMNILIRSYSNVDSFMEAEGRFSSIM